jgi:hypothetical protein
MPWIKAACGRELGGKQPAPSKKRGMTMKHIAWVALAAGAFLVLYAGKDDIRKFRRMRSM